MRTLLRSCALVVIACWCSSLPQGWAQSKTATQGITSWKQIPIPPLPSFHPPQPKRIELSNGMVIFLQEDHELPLVDGFARIRGGSVEEPANKVGLVDLYSEVWRTGGTKTQTGDQLDDFLEIRAAKVETGGGPDSTNISFSCLKGDLDDVFKVFVDVMRNPEFRADKLEIARNGEDDSISRRNDDVSQIAERESIKLAYGPENPYARVPEYATVEAVTRQDLIDWHAKYVRPNNMILGIVGDFNSAEMESRLRAAFESWPKGPEFVKPEIKYSPAAPGYYLVQKTDVNQSNIRMVGLGVMRDNPDFYAISVFNQAFGGGFSSRLFNDIRTKRGLAYDVGGGIGANFGHPGILEIAMGTKSPTTIDAIQATDTDIRDLSEEPITDDEISRAKDDILNAFIFRLDSPDKILAERMTYEFYGYPADWLDKYESEIKKVTAAEVNRVAGKYLHANQLAVLVVGNPKDFDKPLSSLGAVKDIDIAIPPPGKNGASGEQNGEGKNAPSNPGGLAIVQNVATAMGGLDRLKTVKTMRIEMDQSQPGGPASPVELTIAFPNSMRADVQTPQGALTIVASTDAAFMSMGNAGTRSLPPARKAEMLAQVHHDLIYIAQHADDQSFTFTSAGQEQIDGANMDVVDIGGVVPWVRWYVDANGHVVREKYKGMGQNGPFDGETDLSDWRAADGISLPYVHKNKQNGTLTSVVEYKKIEINPPVDSKLFEQPEEKPAEKP